MADVVQKAGLDLVIDAYKSGVDLTLIRENLRLTHEERLLNLIKLQEFAAELKKAEKHAVRYVHD